MTEPQDEFATALTNYRILETYFLNKIEVHFRFNSSHPNRAGAFQNGKIVDLSKEKRTMVLNERKDGMQPILLEWIDNKTIVPARSKP